MRRFARLVGRVPKNQSTHHIIACTNQSYRVRRKISASRQLLLQVGNWLARGSVRCYQI